MNKRLIELGNVVYKDDTHTHTMGYHGVTKHCRYYDVMVIDYSRYTLFRNMIDVLNVLRKESGCSKDNVDYRYSNEHGIQVSLTTRTGRLSAFNDFLNRIQDFAQLNNNIKGLKSAYFELYYNQETNEITITYYIKFEFDDKPIYYNFDYDITRILAMFDTYRAFRT